MELLKKLTYKNLKLNKKRTIVTIVGIILAVALLTALSTLVASFRKSMVESEKTYDGNFHYIFSGATAEDVDDFINNRNVESVFTLSTIGYGKLEGCKNEDKPYAYVCGTDSEGMGNLSFVLTEGRYPEKEGEIVIPTTVKTNGRLDYKIGDKITLEVGNRVQDGEKLTQDNPLIYDDEKNVDEELVDTKTVTYTVVGIMNRPATKVEPYTAPGYTFVTYMEEPANDVTVFTRYTKKGLKNRFEVTANIIGFDAKIYEKIMNGEAFSEEEFDDYVNELENAKYMPTENYYLIMYEDFSAADSSVRVIFVISIIVALIVMVTSVFCIKNSFDISISEKKRQYGMLASIGATKKQIRRSVLYEGFLLGVVGIPLGLLLGLLASFILIIISNFTLEDMLNLKLLFTISPLALAVAIVLGIVTIYLSAIGSARKAAKVSPIAAIRNQDDIKLKSKKIKAPKLVGKIFGVGGVVSYKNIKRNKKKYRTTVVSIIVCTITFIVISYFMSMAFDLVKITVGEVDYSVSLKVARGISVDNYSDSIMELNNVDEIAHYNNKPFEFDNCTLTEEFDNYYKDQNANYETMIEVIIMDDNYFEKFAKEIGVKENLNNKAILVNEVELYTYNEKTKKLVMSTMNVYDCESGDVFTTKDDKYSFEIGAVTNERMLGYRNVSSSTAYIVISSKTAKSYDFDESGFNNEYYFVSDNANLIQDDIDEIMKNNNVFESDYSMYNVDEDRRQMNSLFITMAIFAYGLIGVIALIGITNIINTINTSMQLRSREFATLRSVGMTTKEFNKMIRLESIFTGSKALIIGVPIGLAISYYIYRVEINTSTVMAYRLPIKAVVLCIVVVYGILVGIMNLSLTKINKKNIIETIKDENI